jgi:hypothetical protein
LFIFKKSSTILGSEEHKRIIVGLEKKAAKITMMHNESCSMSYLFYGRMEGGGRGVQMILLFWQCPSISPLYKLALDPTCETF